MCFARMLLLLVLSARAPLALGLEHSRHVVVVVWDGMRPDFISRQNTPTLYSLAQQGVFFTNHHAAFPSSTEVNATVLATGCYPEHNGIVGNEEYRPAVDPLRALRSDAPELVREEDALTGQRYVERPTLPEIIQRAGGHTVVAGAKPVVLLADRTPRNFADRGIAVFGGVTLPPGFLGAITNYCGRFPVSNETNSLRDDWTTAALTGVLWAERVPEFSLLWMNQPDFAQHTMGPGSPAVLACLRDLDRNLAQVLAALDAKGVRDSTDILVLSDHGFSTISAKVDLAKDLQNAGFKASRGFPAEPQPGEILVVSNGATSFLYIIGHIDSLARQVVRFLQHWPFAGVICTREPMAGTFTLRQAHVQSAKAPDVLVSLRWTPGLSTNGTPGLVACDTGYGPGQGTHGSFSPFEMHNFMVAAGPDFRGGMIDPLPSSNLDVAPTVLRLLGIKPPPAIEGRVLNEALLSARKPGQRPKRHHLEAKAPLAGTVWHQYLDILKFDGVAYFEQGNGLLRAD